MIHRQLVLSQVRDALSVLLSRCSVMYGTALPVAAARPSPRSPPCVAPSSRGGPCAPTPEEAAPVRPRASPFSRGDATLTGSRTRARRGCNARAPESEDVPITCLYHNIHILFSCSANVTLK
ncbi:hypothetical protein EYF80_061492 [Liparis tanakae]|uniref:Uncharacterized protein n=1 Tax=Liparis tanakae TaxID=230148 RepID=A0A4Z2EIH3_9TELE|nr:hypothetical protein EYF80_061492 [Liparis tanakae]